MHKRLVAGLSGLVTCLQSNSIGTNFRGLLFKFRRSRAFPFSLMFPLFPFGCLLIGWLQAARWGWGIPPFQGKPKPRSGPPASPGSPAVHTAIFNIYNHKVLLWAQGALLSVMWRPSWRGVPENGHMYMCGWVPLQSIRNYHNIVNWLYYNIKYKVKKKHTTS